MRNIKNWLANWEGRLLSFGGRLTLLKLVRGSLAIFTLSFYKAPKKVVEEIVKIKSNFLWGGLGEKRCINWVSWDIECLSAENGGLGLRRIDDLSVTLL